MLLLQEINKLFCEVVLSQYDEEAIVILQEKKNRIILVQNEVALPQKQVRTCLNGILVQTETIVLTINKT
jgi:phosphoribosylaminoimidazolecarboxamide formyltransferase/IMP cyclohydrolase